jgi:hypothetical protein
MKNKEFIINKAKELEDQFNTLKAAVVAMCDDLDKEDDLEKKEIIRIAVIKAIEDVDNVERKHNNLIIKLQEK